MKFLKYFTFELRLRYRNPSQIFFVFIFPLFLMFAFSSSFGKSIPHYIENNIASILLYSVLSASLTSLSVQIADYQSGKIYQLFVQRGIKKLFYIIAQIVSFMIIIFCSTLVILVVAHYAYDYEFPKLSLLILFYLKLYLYSIPVIKEYGSVSKLKWNMFKDQKWIEIPWVQEEYEEAIQWAKDTLELIENEKEWRPNPNYYYCNYLCGQRNHACEYKPQPTRKKNEENIRSYNPETDSYE